MPNIVGDNIYEIIFEILSYNHITSYANAYQFDRWKLIPDILSLDLLYQSIVIIDINTASINRIYVKRKHVNQRKRTCNASNYLYELSYADWSGKDIRICLQSCKSSLISSEEKESRKRLSNLMLIRISWYS